MKKILALSLTFAMMMGVLTGCSISSSNSADTTAAQSETTEAAASTDERTTFTVGFDAEYPPYGYMDDNGEYTGFDLELAQAVCDLRGWELVKTPIEWASKDLELNSGSIDCIWNGFTMNGREDDYTWSVPYVDNSQVVVVREDSGIKELSDLADKVVGVQAASAALDVLQDEEGQKALADTFKDLQEFPDYNTAFMNLEAGSVEAVAMDIGVAKYQIENRGNGDFVMLETPLSTEQYGIGFKLGNEELRDQVNESLEQLVEDGTYNELAEKYDLTDFICLGK